MKRWFVSKFLWLCIIIWYSVIILWQLGEKVAIFDILSHFYYFYTLLGIVIVGFCLFSRNTPTILTSWGLLIFLLFNLLQADVLVWRYSGQADIFYLNSNYAIREADEIIAEISRHKPRYVMMVEINQELDTRLKQIYKNTIYHPKWALSLGFYTNEDIISSQLHTLSYPVLEVEVSEFTSFLVHPLPPITKEYITLQRENFWEIKELFNASVSQKKMIVGDFNSSFYSPVFKKYFWDLHYTGVYSWGKLWPLAMPIDYAISNNNFFSTHGTNFHISDHIPLLLQLD